MHALLLICLGAGFIACLLESHAVEQFKFIYPPVGQNVMYSGFGNSIPWFMGFCYSVWFGGANYIYLDSKASRMWTPKVFWIGLGSLVIAEILSEITSIYFGIWAYFDDQPFVVFHFPVQVAVTVACMSMVFGEFSRVWFEHMKVAQQWLLLILGPMLLIDLYEAFVFPFAMAIEAPEGLVTARIGSAITIVFTITSTFMMVSVLAKVKHLTPNVEKTATPLRNLGQQTSLSHN